MKATKKKVRLTGSKMSPFSWERTGRMRWDLINKNSGYVHAEILEYRTDESKITEYSYRVFAEGAKGSCSSLARAREACLRKLRGQFFYKVIRK